MSELHRLPAHSFQELAAGRGSPATVNLLRAGQLSICLLRIRAILDLAAERRAVETARSALEQGYQLLAAVQAAAPQVVAQVLGSPEVGGWAMHCVRCLRESVDSGLPVDLSWLGSIAATAGHLAGLDFAVPVAVHDGMVTLPLLGRAHVGTAAPWVTARRDGSGTRVGSATSAVWLPADPRQDGPGWAGLRHLVTGIPGLRLDLRFDDLGPFRGGFGQSPADRLDPATFAGWQRLVDQAWSVLVDHHPDHARALAAGLTTIVPLRTRGALNGMSASCRGSFGAVGLTPPPNAAGLAATLVHEFQHNKLGALLDLVRLHTREGDAHHYAPWRSDPRPTGGLLQGAYAFMGVADFWRVRRTLDGPDARLAQVEFARWRDGVWRTLPTLLDSGELTDLGARFVAGMRDQVARWRHATVPADALEVAGAIAADHEICWRLRNLRPDASAVRAIASAWRDGGPGPAWPVPTTVTGARRTPRLRPNARIDLLYLRVRDPDGFDRLRADPDRVGTAIAGATPADLAYADGDFGRAARGYRAQIDVDPGALQAWAGMALSLRREGVGARSRVLSDVPEVVRAVHTRLDQEGIRPPEPVMLAGWLTSPERAR